MSERPRVNTPFCFAAPRFYPRPNVCEVFNNDGGSRRDAVQNAFAENVVAISSETLFASRKAFKMPFGRLRAVRLEFPFETETSFADFAPAFCAVQSPVTGNSRTAHAEVDTEGLPVACELYIVKFQDDVEREPSFAVHQVSRGNAITEKFTRIGRNGKRDFLPSADSSKVRQTLLPIHGERIAVVARWAERRIRRAYFASFLSKRDNRLDGFGGFLPCLNVQVGDKFGAERFAIAVGEAVQGVGISFLESPALGADQIERLRKLTHRFQQGLSLLRCGIERQSQRSVHASII